MGFLAILNWALANTPGFLRPGVKWLLDLFRKVTSFISSRWNWLGTSVGRFLNAVLAFRAALWGFVSAVWLVSAWIVRILIPGAIQAARTAILRAVDVALDAAVKLANAGLAALKNWASAALNGLRALVASVKTWAVGQLNALIAKVAALIHALAPMLSGPAALAEWLVGAMVGALGRYVYRQRDRVAHWLLDSSPVFTRWLASQLEDMIVRWLS